MLRTRLSTLAVALALAPAALWAAGCSRPPEQQFLTQFFRAAKARDNATTSLMSSVKLDPREQGSVESFSITSIGPEQRAPLSFKALIEADEKAKAEEAEFVKTKLAYQNANIKDIEQVLKLEADPKARFTPALQKVKAEWDKWRQEIIRYNKSVAETRAALQAATGPAEASLSQPGQPALDPRAFDGEIVKKDVTVAAKVKPAAGGAVVDKTLTLTLERVSGTLNGAKREGRPVITKIAGL